MHSSVELSSSMTIPGGQRLSPPNLCSQCMGQDWALLTKSSSIPFNKTPSQDEVHASLQNTTAQPSSAEPIGVPMLQGISVVDFGVFVKPGLMLMQQQQPFEEHSSIGADGRPWNGSMVDLVEVDRSSFVAVEKVAVEEVSWSRKRRRSISALDVYEILVMGREKERSRRFSKGLLCTCGEFWWWRCKRMMENEPPPWAKTLDWAQKLIPQNASDLYLVHINNELNSLPGIQYCK